MGSTRAAFQRGLSTHLAFNLSLPLKQQNLIPLQHHAAAPCVQGQQLRKVSLWANRRRRAFFTFPRTQPIYARSVNSAATLCGYSNSPPSAAFQNDTIYALSSGAGVTAGVAIIRISGPSAPLSLETLLHPSEKKTEKLKSFPQPRYASVRKLYHPTTNELLDEAMVLYFPGPRSFTGEDVVELHVHGSRAVISGVIEALGELHHSDAPSILRPAERGEFTRRAFENGRMDLTGVEGLSDLIAAETAMQRRQALKQLGGEVRDILEGWREEIKGCLAHVEAVIDFGEDVDDGTFEAVVPRIELLRNEMRRYLNDKQRGEIIRGGARIAIVGEPNVGKSTLLNALAKRPAAIVSPHEGTTRDIVEVQLDLNGLAVIVSDTAGLREETLDPIEIEGMRRARDAAAIADVTVLVHDASRGDLHSIVTEFPSRIKHDDAQLRGGSDSAIIVCVVNKMDLMPSVQVGECIDGVKLFKTSLLDNTGIAEFVTGIEEILRRRIEGDNERRGDDSSPEGVSKQMNFPVITRARHRHHLTLSESALTSFLNGRTGPDRSLYLPMDLAAEDLRIAAKEVGAITGLIHAEEVLDVIFGEFCIGK